MATIKEVKEEVQGLKRELFDGDNPASITSLHAKVDKINGRTRENELRSKINRYILYTLMLGGTGGIGYALGKVAEIAQVLGDKL